MRTPDTPGYTVASDNKESQNENFDKIPNSASINQKTSGTKRNKQDMFTMTVGINAKNEVKTLGDDEGKIIVPRKSVANVDLIGSAGYGVCHTSKKRAAVALTTTSKRRLVSPNPERVSEILREPRGQKQGIAISTRRPAGKNAHGKLNVPRTRCGRRKKAQEGANSAQIKKGATTKNRSRSAPPASSGVPVPLEVFADLHQVGCSSPLASSPFYSRGFVDSTKKGHRAKCQRAGAASINAGVSGKKTKGRIRATYAGRHNPFDVMSLDVDFSFDYAASGFR